MGRGDGAGGGGVSETPEALGGFAKAIAEYTTHLQSHTEAI